MGNKKRSPILNCLRSMTPQPGRQPKKLTARKFPKPSIHRVTTKTKWKIRPPSQILVCLDQQRMKKMNGDAFLKRHEKTRNIRCGFLRGRAIASGVAKHFTGGGVRPNETPVLP